MSVRIISLSKNTSELKRMNKKYRKRSERKRAFVLSLSLSLSHSDLFPGTFSLRSFLVSLFFLDLSPSPYQLMSIEHRDRRYELRSFNPHITHKENWNRAKELPRKQSKKQYKKPEKIRFFPVLFHCVEMASREIFHKSSNKPISLSLFTASRETL